MSKTPAEIDALLIKWYDNSSFCSFWHMMVKQEGYEELISIGDPVVPRILKLINEGEIWIGYSQLLCILTKEKPDYQPEMVGGFAAFKVSDFAQSWIEWAKKKGIEIPKE